MRPGLPLLKNPRYLLGLSLLLLILCAVALFLGRRHQVTAAKYMRFTRDTHATMWRIEHLRTDLARAEGMARRPDLDGEIIERIRELCDSVVERATETLLEAPTLEDAYRLRGQALEMKYDFDEALKDHADAVRLFEEQTAHYQDRRNVPYSLSYAHRAFLRTRLMLRRNLLDEDVESLRNEAFQDFRRASASMTDMALRFVAVAATDLTQLKFEDAIRDAGVAADMDPADWRPRLYRAVARIHLKDDGNALADLAEAARLYPYGAEIHAWRGACLHRLGRRPEAIEAFGTARAVDPRFFEAYALRGQMLADDDRMADAEIQFNQAASLRPDNRPILLAHARAAIEAWTRGGRRDQALLDRAARSLDAALALDSRDASACVLRARVRLAAGTPEAAIEDATRALGLSKSANALRVRAEAHAARGEWTDAAADFAAAGSRREHARALQRAGQLTHARQAYDELHKEDPADLSIALERARVILASDDPETALAAVDRILEQSSASTVARILRAEILLSKGEPAAAALEASRAHELEPTQPDALIVRGKALAKQGDQTGARRDWEKAKELAPDRAAEIEHLERSP
ncbi:MAG: tetratricopeptide repeat protein [Planctomycetes bacterium]|nr:tetratricopeptide repeat protein [Planctomycetota bacterium]